MVSYFDFVTEKKDDATVLILVVMEDGLVHTLIA